MARPITITDEQILEAARAVFLRDGFNASTVEIAQRACVAEGTLFRRFATKEGLFRAAVKAPEIPSWVRELEPLAGQGDMRANLVQITRAVIRFAQERMPFVLLRWSYKPPGPDAAPDEEESPIARDSRRLARFLQGEVDRGRLRPCQTEMVARLLVGPCLNLVMDSVVYRKPLPPEEIDRFTADLVETLWEGIGPVEG